MIGQEEFKLMQYADDLILFVPDIECVKRILQLLDRFTFCSGLKVNHTKTEAMSIGSCRQNTATSLGLRWSKSVKALGIDDTDQLQKNFYYNLKDIRTQIRLWNCRGLSLFDKVTVIKSPLLPKMLYVFSVLTTPGEFIKQLNTIVYNFLWKRCVHDVSCTFCRVSPETVNHLFYQCTHTDQFWKD